MQLKQDTINYLTRLAYSAWTTAFDNLKVVINEEEKNDNSTDWKLFHQKGLDHAIKEEKTTNKHLEEIKKFTSYPPPLG